MKIVWSNFNSLANPFAQYYGKSMFSGFPTPGFLPQPPLPDPPATEIKQIGKDEFYKNKVKASEMMGFPPSENNKPQSDFFNNFDYSRINERSLSTNEKLPNLLENIKLNNNLFDFGLINKKVNYKKRDKMKTLQRTAALEEKVIPFIGSNIDAQLMQRILSPSEGATEDLLDYDGVLGLGNPGKKIAIGHKRTKTLYKLNKNLKVVCFF